MATLSILQRKCDRCGACRAACPFSAIDWLGDRPEINAACRACALCVKACPRGAIIRLETRAKSVDKAKWSGVLVIAEQSRGRLHPVSLELIGKALLMNQAVHAVVMGEGIGECAGELLHYGVKTVYAYDDQALSFFRAEAFADCAEDAIRDLRPSVVLVGATALGRSLAPRLATRFRTGLTADCTALEMRENTDLVQIRPAFGGNIMAQIATKHTRPQFATVRYKVMDQPVRQDAAGEIIWRKTPAISSRVSHISTVPVPKAASISDAQVLVVGGRGLKKEGDLDMIRTLAGLLGGEWATTRPLAEKGWSQSARQIGLSGRTVRPKLIITCGVSGAIQFTSSMNASEHTIAINEDPDAPIFDVAHVAVVGDLYQIVPGLITRLKEKFK